VRRRRPGRADERDAVLGRHLIDALEGWLDEVERIVGDGRE
jgi:hypothetical protein